MQTQGKLHEEHPRVAFLTMPMHEAATADSDGWEEQMGLCLLS